MKILDVLQKIETLLSEAVTTARHQNGLEACTVYADPTVCSCRHSNSSAWARSKYCVCGDPTVCSCRHSKLSTWARSM